MTKSDLKTGMWAKTISKLWMIVVIDNEPYMITPDSWQTMKSFPNAVPGEKEWNILAVYDYHTTNYDNKAGSLQYNIFKDIVEDPKCEYFTKIWPIEETIKIGENIYNKAEFEEAVKNLKTINK